MSHRLIGAAALAAHGVARSTRDIDLLVSDPAVLEPALWDGVAPPGHTLEVRRGDPTDPLVGVVRIEQDLPDEPNWDELPDALDVIVVASARGPEVTIGAARCRAVPWVDLVLWKLYAGGPRDACPQSIAEVDARIGRIPPRCARLWARLRS